MQSVDRLDSWKEIARYLRRGTRTARRWEHEEGLPVHRHHHGRAQTVYAYPAEIDEWLLSRSPGGNEDVDDAEEQTTVLHRSRRRVWWVLAMSAALVSAASLLWMSMGVGTVAFQEELLEVRDMPRSSQLEGVLPLTSGEVVDLLLDRVEVGQVVVPSQRELEGPPGEQYVARYESKERMEYERRGEAAQPWIWFVTDEGALCRGASRRTSACRVIKVFEGRYYAVGARSGAIRYVFEVHD